VIRDTGLSSNVLNCGCDCGFVAIPVDVGDCDICGRIQLRLPMTPKTFTQQNFSCVVIPKKF